MRRPLTLLIVADLACVVCGVYLQPNAFMLAAALAGAVLVGLIWPWLSLCGLEGRLSYAASRGQEGEELVVRLCLRNRAPWPALCLALEGACGRDDDEPMLPLVAGWRQTELTCVVTPKRRGVFPIAAPVLATSFPFGLWRRERRLRVESEVLIWPRTFTSASLVDASFDAPEGGLIELARPGIGGDMLGVRPYRRGDSLRDIHWTQSARFDRLITCEQGRLVRIEAMLVLDTARPADGNTAQPAAGNTARAAAENNACLNDGRGADSLQEWAIRVAASIGCRLLDEEIEVTAVVGGRLIRIAGPGARRAWLDQLARLEADACPSLASVLSLPAVRRWSRACQIVVTTAEGLAQLSSPATHARVRRFVVLGRQEGLNPRERLAGAASLKRRAALELIEINDPREAPRMLADGEPHS